MTIRRKVIPLALAPISQAIAQRDESPADQKGGEQDQEKHKGNKRGERDGGTPHQSLQRGRERLSHCGLQKFFESHQINRSELVQFMPGMSLEWHAEECKSDLIHIVALNKN
jgi:hypothetical protein